MMDTLRRGGWASLPRLLLSCSLIFALLSLLFIPGRSLAASQSPITVYLDETPIPFQVNPIIKNGSTLVQFRPLFEKMGLKVGWDPNQRIVSGNKDGLQITIPVGKKEAVVNGQSVQLAQAAEIVDGNTMVPLRFVGEATGAIVHWDPVNREISIMTERYWTALGITKEDLLAFIELYDAMQKEEAEANSPAPTPVATAAPTPKPSPAATTAPGSSSKPAAAVSKVDLNKLSGMYYGWRDDMGGYMCGGICWDFYTFLPNKQLLIGLPVNGGPEAVDCKKDTCLTYTIQNGTITLSNGEKWPISVTESGDLKLNNYVLTPVKPVAKNLKLNNTYKHIGYRGLVGIDFYSSSWTEYLTFKSDGTFESTDLSIASLQSAHADTHSTSTLEDTGTYSIAGNTITFKYNDGTVVKALFFIHRDDITDVHIGSQRFYVD